MKKTIIVVISPCYAFYWKVLSLTSFPRILSLSLFVVLYRVFVTHISDEHQDQLLKLPLTSLSREIKEKWSAEYSVPLCDLTLRTVDLQKIEDETPMEALVEPDSSIRKAISLVMDQATNVFIRFDETLKNLKISLYSPISEIIPDVKKLFDIDSNRLLRLTLGKKILDTSSSLSAQDIDSTASLNVDLGFRILLTHKPSGLERTVTCFASDPLIPSLSENSDVSFKFLGKEFDSCSTVGEVFCGIEGERQSLEICYPEKVFLMQDSGLQEKSVKLPQSVSEVTNLQTEAMWDSQLLAHKLFLCALNFLSGQIITSDVRKVHLRLSNGRMQVLR